MPDEQPLDPLPALVATIASRRRAAPILAKWAWAMFVAFKEAGIKGAAVYHQALAAQHLLDTQNPVKDRPYPAEKNKP